jgi:CBS domain-containing protein
MDIGQNLNTESVRHADPLSPLCVDPETPIREALVLLKQRRRGELLVCRGGRLVGIFTERDFLRLMARRQDLDAPIGQVMTPDPLTVGADDTIGQAVGSMSANGYRRLPIVDPEGRPTGLVNIAGIVHWLVQHFPQAVYNLPPVPNPITQEREGP